MDGEHPTAVKSRKELRKERIMGYLTNKGKLNSKPNIVCLGKKSETAQLSALQLIKGKANKAPVTTFRYEAKNVQPLAPVNNRKPPRKTFVIANKENVRTERQSEQSTLCKRSFTGMYTVNTLKATSLPKKPPNVRIQLTGKASSTFSVAKNSNSAFRPPSNPATSYLAKNYTLDYGPRLSLGPIVKTRTGLIPAMIQPRVARPLPAADAGIVFSRVTVPSSKAMVKKIPLHQRSAVPRELKSLPGKQQSCKSELKSKVTASTSAKLPDNVPKLPAKHTSQPKSRPMTQKSAIGGRTSKKPGMVSRKPMAAKPKMTDAAPKIMSAPVAKQTASRTTVTVVTQPRLLTKATKPQTVGKKMAAEQEERMKKLQAWREAKGISYKRPPMQVKPLVRRAAAAPQPLRTTLKVEDDACAFIRDAERSLSDCIKLLAEGCPAAQVREVLSRLPPVSQKFAKFWICKARLMEQEGDLDILPMFEEAVRVVLEPVDELRTVVFDILKKKDDTQAAREGDETEADRTPSNDEEPDNCKDEDPMETPPVRVLISGEMGPSSNVKYKITATPGAPLSQQRKPIHVDGHVVRFFTPVRRSVRIESASRRYPVPLREHDQCVASFAELLDTEEEEEAKARGDTMYVYRENEALEDKVVVRLVREQDTQS